MTNPKLKGVDPTLARKVEAVLEDMAYLGHPMCVTEGKRRSRVRARLLIGAASILVRYYPSRTSRTIQW